MKLGLLLMEQQDCNATWRNWQLAKLCYETVYAGKLKIVADI
jgi:hypothetical protein